MKTLRTFLLFLAALAGTAFPSHASQYSATVLADTPFAYYRLNETSNAQTVADQMGANSGRYVNGPTVGVPGAIVSDAASTAVSFNAAASQYVQLTTMGNYGSSMTSGFSVEYWISDSNSTTYQAILGVANSGGYNTDFLVDIAYGGNAGRLRLYYRDDAYNRYEADWYPTGGNVNIYDGAWHHVVHVYNPSAGTVGNRVLFYVDGILQTTTVTLGGSVPSSSNFNGPLVVGAMDLRGTIEYFLQGSLDEVALYTSPLSAARVLAHFQAATSQGQGTTPQTINFPAIAAKQTSSAPFTLNATASSGLPVSYAITAGSSVAVLSGNTVTLTGTTGSVTIQASQNGNGTYAAATPVSQSFNVTAAAFVQFSSSVLGSQSGDYTLGIRADGTLWACGANGNGTMGNGSTTLISIISQIGTVKTWQSVAAGGDHVVAVRTDGTLWTWGYNNNGQLGDGTTTQRTSPVQVPGTNWKIAVAGRWHTVAVKGDGTLWAWGANNNGQLGQGTTDANPHSSPVQVGTLTTWGQSAALLAAGTDFTQAIKTDGTLWAWGLNSNGQLGDGTTTLQSAPEQIGTATNWNSVATGVAFSIGRKTDGTTWVWGLNSSGQLGDGTTTQRNSPVQFTALSNVLNIRPGGAFTLAVKTDGTLWSWGTNTPWGQLGINSADASSHPNPVQVGTATNWQLLAPGNSHSVATQSDGSVWSWGNNGNGQLGYIMHVPLPVSPGLGSMLMAGAGPSNIVALRSDGTLWACGANGNGQLGTGSSDSLPHPNAVQMGLGSTWQYMSAGANYVLAVRSDGTLWACGANGSSRLGDGTTTQRNSLVQIGTDNQWRMVSAGSNYSFGVKADGTLWAWGDNTFGQLGDGTTTPQTTPEQVGTGTNWKAAWASTAGNSSLGIKTDSTIWTWGFNSNGQLGQGTADTNLHSTPVQVGTSTWLTAAQGPRYVLAIKSDGTLWAWGSNSAGVLGDGSGQQQNSPVQVGSDNRWTSVSTGNGSSYATKSDGTLWAWGGNGASQLGDAGFTNRSTPKQVGTSTAWSSVGVLCGPNDAIGLTVDGTLWAWGASSNAQIGSAWRDEFVPDVMLPTLSAEQAISLSVPASISVGNSATVAATTTSGLPATFIVTGPATLTGNQLTVTGSGPVTVIAYQPGNSYWQASDIAIQVVNPTPPTATTVAATSITSTTATLNGVVNPNGVPTAAMFQHGTTASYGTGIPVSLVPANSIAPQSANVTITGLAPGTTYHFQTAASNVVGAASGGDQTYTTLTVLNNWRQIYFGTTSNTGSAASTADPYHTGLPNLVAFAFLGPNQNPATASITQLPQPQRSGGSVFYNFTEPAGMSGVTYGAEWSTDLSSGIWTPITDTGSGTTHIFSVSVGSNPQFFTRLRVTGQ
jgi:alpha-tubulin suppressor-like RCC1 family protein